MPIQACVSNESWPDCYYTETTHLDDKRIHSVMHRCLQLITFHGTIHYLKNNMMHYSTKNRNCHYRIACKHALYLGLPNPNLILKAQISYLIRRAGVMDLLFQPGVPSLLSRRFLLSYELS